MQENDELITFEGILDTIIFTSEETHFTVAKLRPDNDIPILIVGTIMATNEGERIRVRGTWKDHPKYGKQLEIHQFEVLLPTEKETIKKYLSSGIIKSVGPSLANRIVKKFGEKSFEILDNEPEKLLEVNGIGKKKLQKITTSWQAQRHIHEAMVFMADFGIRGNKAAKIYKKYGGNLVAILKKHPYRLAIDIEGIGFRSADIIAKKLGIAEDDPERIQAAILHVMNEASNSNGHCYLPEEKLIENTKTMIGIEKEKIYDALHVILKENYIIQIEDDDAPIYLRKLYFFETKVAQMLKTIKETPILRDFCNIEKAIEEVEQEMDITFQKEQKEAIKGALKNKVTIITGGPGVGKTTIIRALVHILQKQKYSIALAAPTGRASKRLSEASDFPATTIHRLLHFNPHSGKFEFNHNQPLQIKHLIIDEASMIDIYLAYHLLNAVPEMASITFVGDADQLPSVGPGNFLGDMIQSKYIHIKQLNKIFRQTEGSSIVDIAHTLNEGGIPKISNHPSSDIFFMPINSSQEGADLIVDLIKTRLPKKYDLDPINDIQVLTPMYRGNVGADNLNNLLAKSLNENGREIVIDKFKENDKVMQIVNNYEKDVYNGDIGVIIHANRIDKSVYINFDTGCSIYKENELDEIVRAYAISIHKSQGSEYPAVVIPIFTDHYIMLERNLLYTAITRGKKIVVIVGHWKAFKIAIQTVRSRNRYTKLALRLTENN